MPSSQHTPSEVFAARRRAVGLTQTRLAGLAQCSRATVAMIEGGYLPRRSEVIPRIEAVLADAALNNEAPAGNRRFEQGARDGAHGPA